MQKLSNQLLPVDTPLSATLRLCTIWIYPRRGRTFSLQETGRCSNLKTSFRTCICFPGGSPRAQTNHYSDDSRSCVGVTFWSQRLGIGALSHSLLPRCPASNLSPGDGHRYVDFAIRDLARQLDELGRGVPRYKSSSLAAVTCCW